MTDRPIIFSAAMIDALRAGRKTQTRRVLKPLVKDVPAGQYVDSYCGEPKTPANPRGMSREWCLWTDDNRQGKDFAKVLCKPGDRLWCREGFAEVGDNDDDIHAAPDLRRHCYYRADAVVSDQLRWRPSIYMPRWASRLTLAITGVKVERLQDISEADAIAEGLATVTKDGKLWKWGVPDLDGLPGNDNHGWHWQDWQRDPVGAYRKLWNAIHAKHPERQWAANPWIIALTFDVKHQNIDQVRG